MTACLAFGSVVYADDVNVSNSNDYLHTDGSKLLDDYGNQVRMTGIAWFGLETPNYCFHGLWANRIDNLVSIVADNGFNTLRVPLSVELVNQWRQGVYPAPDSVNTYISPELKGQNSQQILDDVIAECKKDGVKVMLDMHRIESAGQTATWYTSKYTTDDYEKCWQYLADRYKNDDTVIAADIFNEPHGKAYRAETSAKWNDSTDEDNWRYEAQKVGKEILDINPKMLIVVEGIETYPKEGTAKGSTNPDDYYGGWWGGNLRGVKDYPVDIAPYKNQVVYSPHDYGPGVSDQSWFDGDFTEQSLLNDAWRPSWFYIQEQNIAPLLIGEWGGNMDGGKNEAWMTDIAKLIADNKMNHTFWCLNANSGDTGGILGYDFKTIDAKKLALVQPTLWKDDATGKFEGLDHEVNLGQNGTHVEGKAVVKFKKGDVNDDGVVNGRDVMELRRYLAGQTSTIDKDAADVNGDGIINGRDLMEIMKKVSGNQ